MRYLHHGHTHQVPAFGHLNAYARKAILAAVERALPSSKFKMVLLQGFAVPAGNPDAIDASHVIPTTKIPEQNDCILAGH